MRMTKTEALTQGFIAGLIGYAGVVVFFAVANLLSGHSAFHTPAVLGSVLFYGVEDAATVTVAPGPVLAYNGVHLVLSLLVGGVAAWLVFATERYHPLWYFVFFLFLATFIYVVLAIGALGAEIAHALSWWSVIAATLIWTLSMVGYLYWTHRTLVRTLAREQRAGMET